MTRCHSTDGRGPDASLLTSELVVLYFVVFTMDGPDWADTVACLCHKAFDLLPRKVNPGSNWTVLAGFVLSDGA